MGQPAPRLTKPARREQLLDVAADLLIERGIGALTMEGIAAGAGVSKALPYQHFDNAEDVLVELYRRELATMGARILAALEDVADPQESVRAAVHAYFDAVADRGRILAILTSPGSRDPRSTDRGQRIGHRFVADVFGPRFGITGRDRVLLADFALGVLAGAMDAWTHRDAKRRDVEAIAVEAILAAARAISERG